MRECGKMLLPDEKPAVSGAVIGHLLTGASGLVTGFLLGLLVEPASRWAIAFLYWLDGGPWRP